MQEHLRISKGMGSETSAHTHSNLPLLQSKELTPTPSNPLHHGQMSLLLTQLQNTPREVPDIPSLPNLLLAPSHTLIPTTSPNLVCSEGG